MKCDQGLSNLKHECHALKEIYLLVIMTRRKNNPLQGCVKVLLYIIITVSHSINFKMRAKAFHWFHLEAASQKDNGNKDTTTPEGCCGKSATSYRLGKKVGCWPVTEKPSHCWPCPCLITSQFYINMSNLILSASSVKTSQDTHLRHHFMGHKSLDGSQTELGDLWFFGATAHQERLNDLWAVLLQSWGERD